MGTLINIKNYQKIDITKKVYKEITLINKINIALYHLYASPIPGTVFLHHPEGHFMPGDNIDNYIFSIKNPIDTAPINTPDDLILNHFIITQEIIDENSIILGFFNIATKIYNRYKIKDIKRLCGLLKVTENDFSQILGKASPDTFKTYSMPTDKKIYLSEISSLISNASFTPIQNIHIFEMLNAFTNGGIICQMRPTTII